jgi:thioredoxin-related protein
MSYRLPIILGSALLALSIFLVGAISGHAAERWGTSIAQAQTQAKQENKLVMIDFTGSDWCSWCKKLDREVFSTSQFKQYAAQNLVLVEVDFPQGKPQSAEVKAQNEALAKKYDVEGFPTIIVLSPSGRTVGQLSYMEGGPSVFIAELRKLKK